FALSALGRPVDELCDELHQLLGGPFRRFVKFFHHRLLLLFLLLLVTRIFGGLGRLALSHPPPQIGGGETASPRRGRRAAIFGHDFPPFSRRQLPSSARA